MDIRLPRDCEWVRAPSARLRAASPRVFEREAGEAHPHSVPTPAPAARERVLVEPEARRAARAPVSPVAENAAREQAARNQTAQREADDTPSRVVEARFARFAATLRPGTREILAELFATVREEIAAARAEGDEGRLRLAFGHLEDGRDF
jgi:hypothetical protein